MPKAKKAAPPAPFGQVQQGGTYTVYEMILHNPDTGNDELVGAAIPHGVCGFQVLFDTPLARKTWPGQQFLAPAPATIAAWQISPIVCPNCGAQFSIADGQATKL